MSLVVAVPGMTCRHCVRTVTNALRDVPGVMTVVADMESRTVAITGAVREHDVLTALEQCGFPAAAGPPQEPAAGP